MLDQPQLRPQVISGGQRLPLHNRARIPACTHGHWGALAAWLAAVKLVTPRQGQRTPLVPYPTLFRSPSPLRGPAAAPAQPRADTRMHTWRLGCVGCLVDGSKTCYPSQGSEKALGCLTNLNSGPKSSRVASGCPCTTARGYPHAHMAIGVRWLLGWRQ